MYPGCRFIYGVQIVLIFLYKKQVLGKKVSLVPNKKVSLAENWRQWETISHLPASPMSQL